MTYTYKPKGVCSRAITVTLDGDTVENVEFKGGCPGNTTGVCLLCKGRKVDELVQMFTGVKCGLKSTSCPEQLAFALQEAMKETEAAQKA